ncbi:conjugal transfer protein TraD [Caulobacter flavus]|uniref:Conjugal transfer protein TraD n=1 Tax=Caulobacter flavus TaxID=1679497 RepID=A0A2N5CZH7_9CAUL|nr:conjugal transfer protein TraD [Caulobacter flavus]AYV45091.1 conjugal transfer protein TraD [Caulobacter flavus]PLR19228.1 conjugal transfer protein TraD [Caulobacter flavus]
MRKPRDIDAELTALAAKAKQLKSQKIKQLGELVIATGADELDPEVLAGALLTAKASKDVKSREAWKSEGEAFFRKGAGRKLASAAAGDGAGAGQEPGTGATG